MTPTKPTPGETYIYLGVPIVFRFESINHFHFKTPKGDNIRLTFPQTKSLLHGTIQ